MKIDDFFVDNIKKKKGRVGKNEHGKDLISRSKKCCSKTLKKTQKMGKTFRCRTKILAKCDRKKRKQKLKIKIRRNPDFSVKQLLISNYLLVEKLQHIFAKSTHTVITSQLPKSFKLLLIFCLSFYIPLPECIISANLIHSIIFSKFCIILFKKRKLLSFDCVPRISA